MSKRNTSQSSSAKLALLSAARKLMIARGYTATTLDEVCEEAGYTKGTFFHYFSNKEQIGKELVHQHRQMLSSLLNDAPFTQLSDPLERLCGYIDFVVSMYKDPVGDACLVGMFTEELSDSHPEIRNLCEETFDDWVKNLQEMLDEVQRLYTPRITFDSKGLAEHFIAVFEGAIILAKASKDIKPVKRNMDIYKNFIRSAFELPQTERGIPQ